MKFEMAPSLVALLMTSIGVFGANAAPLTCEAFRDKLFRSISDAGDKVAQPRLTEPNYRQDGSGFARYKLTDVLGMTGNLGCNSGDTLYYFEAAVDLDRSEEGALRLLRLEHLASASACAVVPSLKPSQCEQLPKKLVRKAVNELSAARIRGEVDPSGISTETLAGGGRMEFYADPGRLSFRLAPPYK